MKKKSFKKTVRKPAASRRAELIDCVDALNDHCRHITTLAELLQACDAPESFTVELASKAGYLITKELAQVKALLTELGKGAR
jgi:hypothetical protein